MASSCPRWCAVLAALAAACSFVPSGPRPDDGDGGVDAADLDGPALDGAGDDAAGPDAAPPDAPTDDAASPDAASPDAAGPDATDAAPPDAALPDAIDVDAPPTTGRSLIDDTAADFGQGAPVATESRVEAAGAVAPRAYYRGALCAAGSDSRLFDDGTTATGAVLPASPTKLGLARTIDLNIGSGAIPPGVGITAGTDWTLWWSGELYLTAGPHLFQLDADDHAFLEVAPIGTTAFTKLIGVNVGTSGSATFDAPTSGWYGFRVAVAQRGGPVDLWPRLDGSTIPRYLTRCRVDAVSGLALTGFDESQFLDVAATTVIGDATAANIDWGTGTPVDLGITDMNTFAVRWAGQFYVDVAGSYTLRIQTDDGYRLWVDGVAQFANLGDGSFDRTTGALNLARGWHDVVFDTTESFINAQSKLSVASGPELAGAAFPPARLRPAEGRLERFESLTAGVVAEPGPAVFSFASPASATVTGVDVGYRLNIDNVASAVTTGLRTGSGTMTTLRNGTITGDTTDRFHPTAFDGTPFVGTWGVRFDVASGGGTLEASWLTVRYTDAPGTGPTPTVATFESSVRDLLASGDTAVVGFGTVTLAIRVATGAVVTVAFRTCDAPAACAAAAWSGEFASGDALTGVVPRRYLQYRLRFTTDGDHEPAVERLQLDYRTQ